MTSLQERIDSKEAFEERVFASVLGAFDVWSFYLGEKLGLYAALASKGPMTSAALAAEAGIAQRYADEWLEHQVTCEILEVDDPSAPADRRTYSINPGHAEVLTEKDSLSYLAPFVRLVVAGSLQLPALVDAYRTGGGVPWAQYGSDMRTGQAEMNRPWFLTALGEEWFPGVAWLHELLSSGARVADVGCGEGWSSIGMAQAYPAIEVDAFDIDGPSIEAAQRHAVEAGVADRVRFHARDAAEAAGDYDLVTAFECIHDVPDPVSVLATMRTIAGSDGRVVVMDEAVGEAFGERTDEIERLMYGFSLFVCLPDGLSHEESVGTGTVMRPSTLAIYAELAGFSAVDQLPIENDLWRFYELAK